MFKKALVATDLSSASDQFIKCLHGLKPLGTEQIILTHALGIRHIDEMKYQLAPLAEPKLNEQKAVLEEQGFVVESAIVSGPASWEVNQVARDRQASLIVIGSHGATLAREVLLGSVALEIVHNAELPVFVAQLKIDQAVQQRCEMICTDFHRHVIFPTDFSDNAERAFNYLEEIVRTGGKRVTLLHVQDSGRLQYEDKAKLDEHLQIDRQKLERMATRLRELGADEIGVEILRGSAKKEVVRKINDSSASLTVMGTQGRGFFGEIMFGSIAHHVVRHTVVPTLLVPPLR